MNKIYWIFLYNFWLHFHKAVKSPIPEHNAARYGLISMDTKQDHVLDAQMPLFETTVINMDHCVQKCLFFEGCYSVNFDKTTFLCQLLSENMFSNHTLLLSDPNWTHGYTHTTCAMDVCHGSTCHPNYINNTWSCQCRVDSYGLQCVYDVTNSRLTGRIMRFAGGQTSMPMYEGSSGSKARDENYDQNINNGGCAVVRHLPDTSVPSVNFWRLDMKVEFLVQRVKVFNRGDYVPENMNDVGVYLGKEKSAAASNLQCAVLTGAKIQEVCDAPSGIVAQYVFLQRLPTSSRTEDFYICELDVYIYERAKC